MKYKPVSYSKTRKTPPENPKAVWWRRPHWKSDGLDEWELWSTSEFSSATIKGWNEAGNMYWAYPE